MSPPSPPPSAPSAPSARTSPSPAAALAAALAERRRSRQLRAGSPLAVKRARFAARMVKGCSSWCISCVRHVSNGRPCPGLVSPRTSPRPPICWFGLFKTARRDPLAIYDELVGDVMRWLGRRIEMVETVE